MKHRDRLQRLAGSLVMSSFMSLALSGVFSVLEFGISWLWLQAWARSILIAVPIAFSLDLIFGDTLRFLSDKLAHKAASAWQ